ncbi:MAG: hypothetical protein IJY66_03465 [Clostridia bacterium]|nr:hypothetical protein [Clostridia bacterium]
MKKNEQLFRAIGKISPTYIEMAADGKVPGKKTRASAPWGRFRALGVIAAMITLSILMFTFGFSVSALSSDQVHKEYQTGTLLTEIPRVMLAEDFEKLSATMEYNLTTVPDGKFIQERHLAFYWAIDGINKASIKDQSEETKQDMLELYPVLKLPGVYVINPTIVPKEESDILYTLMFYGEMNQEKLCDMYQRVYDAVEASDLSTEEKNEIFASLPEKPLVTSDLQIGVLTGAAFNQEKTVPSPDALPSVMLAEDYEAMLAKLLETADVDSWEEAPHYAQRIRAFYVELDPNDEDYMEFESALAPLVQEFAPIYVLAPDIRLWERSWLCSMMALYGGVWMEESVQITQNVHDAIDMGGSADKDALHEMTMNVWSILNEVMRELQTETQ